MRDEAREDRRKVCVCVCVCVVREQFQCCGLTKENGVEAGAADEGVEVVAALELHQLVHVRVEDGLKVGHHFLGGWGDACVRQLCVGRGMGGRMCVGASALSRGANSVHVCVKGAVCVCVCVCVSQVKKP